MKKQKKQERSCFIKWFKHDTDASSDIRIVRLERQFGAEGYAIFFKLLEIVGREGDQGRISFVKYPKFVISEDLKIDSKKFEEILKFMGKIHLCCNKSLKRNVLYFPKFKDRVDNYTARVLRKYEQTSNNVPLEKNRIDKNRTDKEEEHSLGPESRSEVSNLYVKLSGMNKNNMVKSDWSRINMNLNKLYVRTNRDVNMMKEAIYWQSEQGYNWTLETVLKKFPDFLNSRPSRQITEFEERVLNEKG